MADLKEIYERTLQKGKTFILTEEMLSNGIKKIDKSIQSIEDLIMVHKTNFFPDGTIKTPSETGKSGTTVIRCMVDGKEKEYGIPVMSHRNTVHFCLNSAVESHAYGEWDETKYAILMPLAKNKNKIVGGTECDLFTLGSVPITDNAYILCPKGELDVMRKANQNAQIIGYEGDSVSPYVNIFLTNILEYKYKEPTENSRNWNSGYGKDHENVYRIIQENGWQYVNHNGSKWDYDDYTQQNIDILNGWLKTIINEKLLYSANNMEEMKKILINIFNVRSIWNGFNFASMFANEEQFILICDKVRDETGIDLSSFAGTEIQRDFDSLTKSSSSQLVVSDYIVNKLRIKALKEKMQTGNQTEEDKFELHYYEEFGEYANITPDKRKLLTDLEKMHSKSISDLSKDELETLMEATNFKLQNINKLSKDNHYSFRIEYFEGITLKQASDAAKIGLYRKPIKPGIYLTVQVLNPSGIFSEVSRIDIQELYEKSNLAKTDMELYSIDEQIANIPNCHLLEFREGKASITDCDLSSCKTVNDFETSVMKYSEFFSKLISGQEVKFDSIGNDLLNENNTINIKMKEREIKIEDNNFISELKAGVNEKIDIDTMSKISDEKYNEKEKNYLIENNNTFR